MDVVILVFKYNGAGKTKQNKGNGQFICYCALYCEYERYVNDNVILYRSEMLFHLSAVQCSGLK